VVTVQILSTTATELFVGPDDDPRQVVHVEVVRLEASEPADLRVHVRGPAVVTPDAGRLELLPGDRRGEIEVGITTDAAVGSRLAAEVVVEEANTAAQARHPLEVVVAEPGWRMFMISHFHYDPVWWNTQAAYTELWEKRPRERPWEAGFQQTGFTLVDAHLDMARRDPDYRFVLAELDYLKPFWDRHPEERAFVRRLLAEGRLELVGGTYNEANTNLVSAENTIRNTIYGIGYQRGVIGGSPTTAWQLDVFGHDPQFPALAAAAGLEAAAFARGPYHEWGPNWWQGPHSDLRWRHGAEGATVMSFPTEFEWVAPSGRGLLTHYMANHYSAGWWLDSATTLEAAQAEAYRLFRELAEVATTRNVLLPVGTDYAPPNRWVTRIARDWNARYVWPRFRCATAAVSISRHTRAHICSRTPNTRTSGSTPTVSSMVAMRSAEMPCGTSPSG
jgi:alpha-mannosidase